MVYFSKALKLSSELSLSDFPFFLNSKIFFLICGRVKEIFFKEESMIGSDSMVLIKRESIET